MTNTDSVAVLREYADRDHEQLGEHYVKHVAAMTAEGLHAKSDIAAELAWRDQRIASLTAELEAVRRDAARLDYIERTFSGMTNRERYLPVQMIWGKGCNGRTLREACDKYMARDAARHQGGHPC